MKWKPTSEELPVRGKRVIVCTESGFVCEAFITEKGKWFRHGCEDTGILAHKVIAWQEFPERYRA